MGYISSMPTSHSSASVSRRALGLTAALACLVAPSVLPGEEPATPPVLHVADFGAIPGDGKDDTVAVRAAFDAAIAQKATKLVFAPGVYEFIAAPLGADLRVFSLSGASDLTIEGSATEWRFNGLCTPLHIARSHGVTLRGITVDWQRPPFSQGLVTAVEGTTIEVTVDPAFPVTDQDEIYAVMDYDTATGKPVGALDAFHGSLAKAELIRPQVYRLTFASKHQEPESVALLAKLFATLPGRTMVLRHHLNLFACHGIDFESCKDTLVEDVTIRTCVGLGFHDSGSENLTCRRLVIAPKPGSGRLMSSTLDGWHVLFMRGTVRLEDSTLTGMGDDCVNVWSKYLAVKEKTGPDSVSAPLAMGGWRGPMPQPGESIELAKGATLQPYATRVVKAAAWDDGRKAYSVTFTEPLPAEAAVDDLLWNSTYLPKVTIRNCTLGGNRARGVLVSTPDVTVENCRISGTTHAGMLIFAEPRRQARVPDRALIRNNTFSDCGGTAIFVYAMATGGKTPISDAIHGVEISGNRISYDITDPMRSPRSLFPRNFYWQAGICATSVSGLVLRDNQFSGSFTPTIALGFSHDAVIAGNTVSSDGKLLIDPANVDRLSADGNTGLTITKETISDPQLWREWHYSNLR